MPRKPVGSLVFTILILVLTLPSVARDLPDHVLVGYWHNWTGSPNALLLSELPEAYDVINLAFAEPTTPHGATMQFTPHPDIYPIAQNFKDDVESLQSAGKKVLISVGGAAGSVLVDDPADVEAFATSMLDIITTYGVDGLDIDLEGGALLLQAGDSDFRFPTTPRIVYFIEAMNTLLDQLPADFILTAAPETATVQGGYAAYGGVWGAYLPVLHAFHDRLTYVHVQHYNTGSMYGRDGHLYDAATADFHVAMADMLLAGFTVSGGQQFAPFTPGQVMIGLPAGPQAAGSGYTPPATVHQALDYLLLGESFGGAYELSDPDGYYYFHGLMTWSINWDVYYGEEFADSHGSYFDALVVTPVDDLDPLSMHQGPGARLSGIVPNPFNPRTRIMFSLDRAERVNVGVYELTGKRVAVLADEQFAAGEHSLLWNGCDMTGRSVPSGTYLVRLDSGATACTQKLMLVR